MSELPKYALTEIERRWLVDLTRCPPLDGRGAAKITDRYLSRSLLRLRKIECSTGEVIYKLCKKYDRISSIAQPIVNIYLSVDGFELLNQLPGPVVVKWRHRCAEGAIDVYGSNHVDLAIFEVEFGDASSAAEYAPPEFVLNEVTDDPSYSGAYLAGAR